MLWWLRSKWPNTTTVLSRWPHEQCWQEVGCRTDTDKLIVLEGVSGHLPMLKPASDICLFTLKKGTRQLALHSGLVFKPTLPVTSTPHIFTLPLTANLSLPLPTPLLFLQTTHLCCCESAAADRPFLIINHCWLHSQAGPHHVSSRGFMGFQKKELCTPEKNLYIYKKSPCQGKHRWLEEEDSRDGGFWYSPPWHPTWWVLSSKPITSREKKDTYWWAARKGKAPAAIT